MQLKVYNSSDHLVLVLNANEEEERGLKDQIGLGLKIVAHEMTASVRYAAVSLSLYLRSRLDRYYNRDARARSNATISSIHELMHHHRMTLDKKCTSKEACYRSRQEL